MRVDARWSNLPEGGYPTLLPLLLRSGGHAEALLAAGAEAATLLTPMGTRLTEFPIPSPPVGSFEAVDFDGARGLLTLRSVASTRARCSFVLCRAVNCEAGCDAAWLTQSSSSMSAGDGLTDLFLRTHKGVYAWRQIARPGALPFMFLIGFLVLAAGLAFVVSQQSAVYGPPKRSTDME